MPELRPHPGREDLGRPRARHDRRAGEDAVLPVGQRDVLGKRREGWGNVELVHSDAAALDLGAVAFAGVLCVLGLSAVKGCGAVLQEGGVSRIGRDARRQTVLNGAQPWLRRHSREL